MLRQRRLKFALLAAVACSAVGHARADTLEGALADAYRTNPTLNAQRASVRAIDENVPQALAGYRPRVSVTATGGQQSLSTTTKVTSSPVNIPGVGPVGGGTAYPTQSGYNTPFSTGLTITQTLFNGFQTANRTRQAESQVLAARANLSVSEQNVLLNAVIAYMNLLRDAAIVELQKSNVEVLQEQLRQTRDRFNVGEVTRTDVAQAESSLAGGRSQLLTAQANYTASAATYRQVIGHSPGRLAPASPVDRFSPNTLDKAVALGIQSNPAVATAEFNVDAAQLNVKIQEGALLPNLAVQGSVQKSYLAVGNLNTMESFNASVLGTLTIPIYQGGSEYSLIRQAKETLGQRRLDLATARDQVRQSVVQAWGQLDAAKANIEATQAQVQAAEIALNGIREEARVGQRTTFDVLTAQQTLVNARVAVVTAQHDRIVASYTLLANVGRLEPSVIGLPVQVYQPQVHYMQVRDAWAGTRNPDGR
jgi:outer membrane protein